MEWCVSHRADPLALPLADRHYNRQKPGTPQFVPPGSCCVFVTQDLTAFWVTSAPIGAYVKHAWPNAWVCSAFRSERGYGASDLIRQALAATRWHYRDRPIPDLGMITFVDPEYVKPTLVRGEKIYGYCYKKAGFKHVGFTKAKLWAWQLMPSQFPSPSPPLGRDRIYPLAALDTM
jgi:hypothetical protein